MHTNRKKYRLLYQLEEHMEIPMFLLAIFWLYLFLVELIKGLTPLQDTLIYIVWGIFIFEFLLKLFLAPRKGSYLKKNWLTAVALVIPALRVFRLLYALRLLQSARFISSTRIIRALTSGKRLVSALQEAQGPPPTAEMHIGLLIEYSKPENLESIQAFAQQLSADVTPPLENATGIQWHFHLAEPARMETDKPIRASAFIDDASLAMAQGPFDAVVVLTDVRIVSRKNRLEAGLASPTSRIAVMSLGKLKATGRKTPDFKLPDNVVRWNAAQLLLHLLGDLMGLPRSRESQTAIMAPFSFSEKLTGVPSFQKQEKEILRRKLRRLPERELREANRLETLMFHILMAFRHPKEVLLPLVRNRALLLPLSLPGLATAAVAPSFLLVFTAEIWDVGLNMGSNTATAFAVICILSASFYLVQVQSLFLPRKEKGILTEHLAVANTVIYLTIFLACTGLFLLVGGLMMVIELYVFPADLMQTWPTLDQEAILWQDKVRLAAFISTVGVITGALAGGLESRTVLQHLALFKKVR